jgi:ParB/RepB/Spo0J family partition protein
MAELRSVNPRTLHFNPNNPRRTAAPPAMDAQLIASIKAVGIIQPPLVTPKEDGLMVAVGERRVRAAIAAELPVIDVLIGDADEAADAMRAVAENLIRAAMSSVDIWRAIERLEAQGWNEQAIADALALPVRTVRRLKLLAHLHAPILDAMAQGSMPSDEQLRTIAMATREEQAQVWKKHRPRKGRPEVSWYEVARALAKRRMPAAVARFDDELAKAHGVVWEDDLFAPAGEDSRTTTQVEGFFGAQQEWLQQHLPEGGILLALDEYGHPELPKKAERVWGKPGKGDVVGHYVDPRSGEVTTLAYRLPVPKKAAIVAGATTAAKPRPEVTQKGIAKIGELRTDALHQVLAEGPIEDDTLLGLLVLALACDNVQVDSSSASRDDRREICLPLIAEGVLAADSDRLRGAARQMLIAVLSCRENRTQSGAFARVAGETISASERLPNMATEDFLSCLSRSALETAARTQHVNLAPRAKHTRARLVTRFKDGRFVYPGALFRLSAEEEAALAERREHRQPGWVDPEAGEDDETAQADAEEGRVRTTSRRTRQPCARPPDGHPAAPAPKAGAAVGGAQVPRPAVRIPDSA